MDTAAKTREEFEPRQLTRFLLHRPELGPAVAALVTWVFLAITTADRGFLSLRSTAAYLEISAQLGILAIFVALLMIGGEFDLSIGSTIGFCGMVLALLLTQFDMAPTPAFLITVASAVLIGLANGFLVIKTRLPSFIVTLATLFIIRGATIGMTRALTRGVQVGGIRERSGWMHTVFAGELFGFPISIVYALGMMLVGSFLLRRLRFGNWIYATGGDVETSRRAGVPVARVKLTLFLGTALAAALIAITQVVAVGSADVLRGQSKEFEAIAAAVIGGTLLTGGYGTVLGAILGAFTFGVIKQGIFFTGIDAEWYRVVLGSMVLLAVLGNRAIQAYAFKRQ